MPAPPADLTVTTLTHAKGEQLKYWVDEANRGAGKRVLTKGGKVNELRLKLAEYYTLDLSSPPAAPIPAGPATRDLNIQKRQWAHLRALGDEWKRLGDSFQLCKDAEGPADLHPQLHQDLLSTLTSLSLHRLGTANVAACPPYRVVDAASPETIRAWMQAANNGDVAALAALFQLQNAIQPMALLPAFTADRAPTPAPASAPPPPPPPQPLSPRDIVSLSAARSTTPAMASDVRGDAAILASGEHDIEALNRATNLREVIAQVDSVSRMRTLYGPQKGRAAHPLWPRMKGTVNRREKVASQLTEPHEFDGDKERFFAFFTSARSKLPPPKKRKSGGDEDNMVPYRLMVEAISHRDRDIHDEKKKLEYVDVSGSFSLQRWQEKWSAANDWEVWRALGKEYYKK